MNPIKIALLCLVMGSSYSFAECSNPTAPEMPNGSTASMDEMLAGKAAVSAFQKENATYLECIGKEMEAIKATLKEGSKEDMAAAQKNFTELADTYNQAVTAEETLAGKFNTEIRAFKEASKK
ncbi:hypothetical protein [Pseudomaricurvus sp.]|uniref:hypothetical protein n=1 Tax=Pseudomaricurvus sp. TaxID=2004510 RepID=UPI003F6AC5BF